MALISGTTGNDTLRGTSGDDILQTLGGADILLGRGGSDTYELQFQGGYGPQPPNYRINETNGGDAAADTITGLSELVPYNSFSATSYAAFRRAGADGQHLVIDTAYKAGSFRVPAYVAGTIQIINQHSSSVPNAHIETLVAGGIEYNLLSTDIGTAENDIITGWKYADTLSGGAGDDYISGGRGRDELRGEDGNDILFGDAGGDRIFGGAGLDRIFGGAGNDRAWGGTGNDLLSGDAGRDVLRGDDGDDTLFGGTQNDRLFGGNGNDRLAGDAGNDLLIGNKGGDTYVFSSFGDGMDIIHDRGNAAYQRYGWLTWNMDEVEFTGYETLDDAVHNLKIEYSGDDLILTYSNPATPGVTGQITVQDHFLGDRYALEQIDFGTGTTDALYHISHLSGDDFTYSVHGGSDAGGNDIVLGTTEDDEIYGGLGSDIMYGGGGADHFMFHDEEDGRGGTDLILDFDLSDDVLDFTDIAGFGYDGLTITQSASGNALITSIYGAIELDGIAAADVSADIFAFA